MQAGDGRGCLQMELEFDPAAASGACIDEAGVQRLKALLEQHAVPQGGMSLEMVDGFFSALQVAPQSSPPGKFLPRVCGDAPWPDAASLEEVSRLLSGLWRLIEQRLAIDPDGGEGSFMPLLSFPAGLPDDDEGFQEALAQFEFPLGAAWAGGFLHAVQLEQPSWATLEQKFDEVAISLSHLFRLVTLQGDDAHPAPDGRERIALMATMPYVLRALKALRDAKL
ncbi:UPF0149 family protein [Pseudomarimonas arenosa]|uniref:UPF0149 family protein n=1 Tax=Pseudomarimonas arenosa TaxID=2774145 RepID=A0AAW3ZHX7_9GAMM|nr:UPF0149 family protein [Pseudomarimonas arenosa]MBD8525690.1 UPF0149 family protein [Pseudomarimonas arenosa]